MTHGIMQSWKIEIAVSQLYVCTVEAETPEEACLVAERDHAEIVARSRAATLRPGERDSLNARRVRTRAEEEKSAAILAALPGNAEPQRSRSISPGEAMASRSRYRE